MKFGILIIQNQIPEWKDFYINYDLLKNILNPLKQIYKKNFPKDQLKIPSNLNDNEDLTIKLLDQDISELNDFEYQKKFYDQIFIELNKVEYFFSQNYSFYKSRLRKINEQLEYIKKNKDFQEYKERLELAIKEQFKEMTLLKDYIELNLKAKVKILKKFKKLIKFSFDKYDVEKSINDFIQKNEFLSSPFKLINDINSEIEKIFFNNFFEKYSNKSIQILKDYINPRYFTQTQSFYLGFFSGILFLLLSSCYLISYDYNIDMDDDYHFKSIFPMFRGYGIICLYLWLLGLNVYAWNVFNINYKLCFDFKSHYSNVISIFQRAAVFSSVFVLMILFYMILRTQIPVFLSILNYLPIEILPLICWLVLLIYLFFPVKNSFNYEGRIYTLTLLIESFLSIFNKIEFKHVWFTDQITSFIGPIRDAEYSFCYYVHFNSTLRKNVTLKIRNIYQL